MFFRLNSTNLFHKTCLVVFLFLRDEFNNNKAPQVDVDVAFVCVSLSVVRLVALVLLSPRVVSLCSVSSFEKAERTVCVECRLGRTRIPC